MAVGMIVYQLTNKLNGKSYIGQTVHSLENRVQGHCHPRSSCRALKSAIDKYGLENFNSQILVYAQDYDELNYYEEKLIKDLNTFSPNGYNLKTGGVYSRPCQETKNLTRKSCLGRKQTEETKRKIGLANRGKPGRKKSPEEIEKIRKASLGRKHTPETRKKLSQLAILQHQRQRGSK